MMRFYIETYGCSANQGNSEEAEECLVLLGHSPSTEDRADLIIVNTCAVTARTQRKMLRRLLQLQGERLVVAGCLSKALPESLQGIEHRMMEGILGRAAAERIALLEPPSSGGCNPWIERRALRVVNISEGCLGSCSYCLVKRARGCLVSLDDDQIAAKVARIVKSGAVEVQLASQDVAAYGVDIGSTLPRLLRRLIDIPGPHRFRLGMMNPSNVLPIIGDLTKAYDNPRIYRFLHLPLQSGSDRVLESMNRGYSAEDFRRIVACFRRAFPDITIVTDCIAGFPGETESDHEATMELLRGVDPDKVNVTRYSSRPHTSAAHLYDMPERIKKGRSRALTRLWLELAAQRNERYLGRTVDVLVTERGRDKSMKARLDNYIGLVLRQEVDLGTQQKARIVDTNPFYLTGDVG